MTNAEFNQLLTELMASRGLRFRKDAVEYVAKLVNRNPGTVNGWRYNMPIPEHMAYILKSKLKRG